MRRARPASIPTTHDAVVAELHRIYPGHANITAKTHLYDNLGMDSLDAIELQMALEDRLGIDIEDDYMRDVETVGNLVKKLEGR